MFWIGLFIGLFIGANVGLVVLGLFAAKRTGSSHECYDLWFFSRLVEPKVGNMV